MKPGPPINLKVIDFTKESVTLSWLPPTDTGRGKIFGYLLEFQKAGEEEWTKVRKSTVQLTSQTHLIFDDLLTYKLYSYKSVRR